MVLEVHFVVWVGNCGRIDGCYTQPFLPGLLACDACGVAGAGREVGRDAGNGGASCLVGICGCIHGRYPESRSLVILLFEAVY